MVQKNSHKGLTSGQWFAMFWQTLMQAVGVREKETERGTVREEHHTHTHKKSDEINRDEGRLGKYAEPK